MPPAPSETTSRKTQAVPAADELLQLILENVTDYAVLAIDLDGRFATWNVGGERILGYTEDEVLGQSAEIIFTPEDRAAGIPERELAAAVARGRTEDERWHLRKDGRRFWGSGVMTSLRDPSGALRGFVKIMRDSTAQKRAEEEAHAARRAAELANQAKDEFLATVSHDLRTPLGAIVGWAHMLENPDIDKPTREKSVATIVRNANLQLRLVSDLLDMSRIVSGQLRLDVQEVELIPVIHAALDTFQPALAAKGLRLNRRLDPAAEPVLGDPLRLQQVVWNLMSNAIKFTPPGGAIEVRLERAGRQVRIVVEDTGVGISAELLPFVFDRFRQTSSAGRHAGLGLGLAIVRHLVELHGGSAEVHSAGEGRGARFTVAIPWWNPRELDMARPGAEGNAVADLSGMRVLILEDEPDSRELLQTMLEIQKAEVRAAGAAGDALALIPTFRPDVIVSDIHMPDVNGYDFIRAVRALPPDQGGATPAIALTALARREDHRRALDAGYQVHVPKPVTPAKLAAVLGFVQRQRVPGSL